MTDTDTEILRQVLRFCSDNLEIAERFYDAPSAMILNQIVNIIEQGGVIDADTGSECDCERFGGGTSAGGMAATS